MKKEFRKTRKIKKKGSILKNRFFWLGVSIAVFTELLLYLVVLLPLFQIQEVRVKENIEVSENKIKSVVLQDLWKRFLFFPTASILLADTQGIGDNLLETLLELETVSIQRKFPNVLVVSVQEKRTVALWCKESRCFALDNEGVAFKKAHVSTDFPVITSLREAPENLGETVVTKDALLAVLDFSREMKRRSLLLGNEVSVRFRIVSENQIDAATPEGWSIYFTRTQDLFWQITKLQTVLENKIPPEKRRKLEYIDVRFGDQAYLKYR